MASTNKTPNFDLSQYIGSDKPTYLGDYNSDMSKIDTAMATNKTNSENAVTVATGANETATNAQTTATNAQNTATQANTLAQTAKAAADNAQASADKAEKNIEKLNLTYFKKYTASDIQVTNGSVTSADITVARNEDGSVAKIYGACSIRANNDGEIKIQITNTGLTPSETININCVGIRRLENNFVTQINLTISPNGTISITSGGYGNQTTANILFPCLYFIKNFNDELITE